MYGQGFFPRLGVLSGFVFQWGTLPLASPGTLDGSLRLARHHTVGSQLVLDLEYSEIFFGNFLFTKLFSRPNQLFLTRRRRHALVCLAPASQ